MKKLTLLLLMIATFSINAQNPSDYYYEIPDYPNEYTAGTVAARVVDGLGFRYYWATAGLTKENMSFKSNKDGRTIEETMDHILGLTRIVMNATKKVPTKFGIEYPEQTFEQKREQTLEYIKAAREILIQASDEEFAEFKMIFHSADGSTSEYPFWNELNGPLADALWHTGQVVLMRRGAGNPFSSKVSVLAGKVRDN